jgi:Mg-chelatase subunit ChlD
MQEMKTEPVDGLNSFYEDQKKVAEFNTTLVFFNDKPEFIFTNKSSSELEKLSYESYKPSGMTALYDAIGTGIEKQKEIQVDDVICVVLTDGLENCSKEYTIKEIKSMISTMEKEHKWKFIYLGANQDAFTVGNSLGINHSIDYDYTELGCNRIMRTVSDQVSRCISVQPEPESKV